MTKLNKKQQLQQIAWHLQYRFKEIQKAYRSKDDEMLTFNRIKFFGYLDCLDDLGVINLEQWKKLMKLYSYEYITNLDEKSFKYQIENYLNI